MTQFRRSNLEKNLLIHPFIVVVVVTKRCEIGPNYLKRVRMEAEGRQFGPTNLVKTSSGSIHLRLIGVSYSDLPEKN